MIDWNRVTQLRDEIGAEDFDEVVEIFLEEVEEEIAELRTNPAPETLEAKLHFLKGSALNLGFDDFSRLCKDVELTAARGDASDIDLANIVETYTSSKTKFLGALPHLASD
ncbi:MULTISPECIES: Hpt domain-containing protein [Roseovarius]|uniref:Hpt domain-containing protein n=1 Tax=Roseovarius TaxID=74030 RepID=UPI000CDD2487|nr:MULTISPECIES: Hpt domain-containing protein [Roseovarius]